MHQFAVRLMCRTEVGWTQKKLWQFVGLTHHRCRVSTAFSPLQGVPNPGSTDGLSRQRAGVTLIRTWAPWAEGVSEVVVRHCSTVTVQPYKFFRLMLVSLSQTAGLNVAAMV